MLKTGFNLISSLVGGNSGPSGVTTPGTVTTYVPHPEAYRSKPRGRPSISRQIQYEPEEEYELTSIQWIYVQIYIIMKQALSLATI
jgi:hypothetical protein